MSAVVLNQCWHTFTLTFGGCLLFTVTETDLYKQHYTDCAQPVVQRSACGGGRYKYSSSDEFVSLALETGCTTFLPVGRND